MRHILLAMALCLPMAAQADEVTIEMRDFSFTPAEINVAAGTTVAWTNRDDEPHQVVDADNPRRMKSPPLETGDSFRFVTREAGVLHYFCALHPHMQGTVVVR